MSLKFTERVKLKQGNDLIVTYRAGVLGMHFFAYIKCTEQGVKLMREDYESGTPRDPSEYGEIIYRDNIRDPDEKAKTFLKNYLAESGGEVL